MDRYPTGVVNRYRYFDRLDTRNISRDILEIRDYQAKQ